MKDGVRGGPLNEVDVNAQAHAENATDKANSDKADGTSSCLARVFLILQVLFLGDVQKLKYIQV